MYTVSGQQSWNFFKNDFNNHIPRPGFAELPLAIKFATATANIQQVRANISMSCYEFKLKC